MTKFAKPNNVPNVFRIREPESGQFKAIPQPVKSARKPVKRKRKTVKR